MKSLLPLLLRIILKATLRSLDKDSVKFLKQAKEAALKESTKVQEIAEKASAKRAAIRAKLEAAHDAERLAKATLFAKTDKLRKNAHEAKAQAEKLKILV